MIHILFYLSNMMVLATFASVRDACVPNFVIPDVQKFLSLLPYLHASEKPEQFFHLKCISDNDSLNCSSLSRANFQFVMDSVVTQKQNLTLLIISR